MDTFSYLLGKSKGGGGPSPSGDLTKYFITEINENTSSGNYIGTNVVKTTAPINVNPNVTNLSWCFRECKLKGLDVSQMDTSNITNMSYMFQMCSYVEKLDVENWNVSNVTTFNSMFQSCSNLKKLDLSKWQPKDTADYRNMFNSCLKLAILDISSFNYLGSSALTSIGASCLQSDGGYADGIPYVYVKNSTIQQNILNKVYGNIPSSWTTANVVIKS